MTAELSERQWAKIRAKKKIEFRYTRPYIDFDPSWSEREIRTNVRAAMKLMPDYERRQMYDEIRQEHRKIDKEFDKIEDD